MKFAAFGAMALAAACGSPAVAGGAILGQSWSTPTSCTDTDWLKCMTGNKSYQLTWQEEFTDLSLGNVGQTNTRWFAGVHPVLVPGEKMAFAGDPSAYKISQGSLNMSTQYVDDKGTSRYAEADMETYDGRGHGMRWQNFYAEVRFKGQVGAANHSGVWFLSADDGKSDSTGGHAEVDMLEQYGPADQFDHSSSHIWPGNRKDIQHMSSSVMVVRPEGKAVQWHTYGLLATDDKFVVIRDGKPTTWIPRLPQQKVPMYLLISLMGNPNLGKPTPTAVAVEYVRIYTPVDTVLGNHAIVRLTGG